MSPILINAQTSGVKPPKPVKKSSQSDLESTVEEEPTVQKARDDRKATGRSIAIIIFVSLMCLALYHIFHKKTSVLAGVSLALVVEHLESFLCRAIHFSPRKFQVLVPALILFTYLFFVIHVSSREKKRRKQLVSNAEIFLIS
jgi:hypothetical protein